MPPSPTRLRATRVTLRSSGFVRSCVSLSLGPGGADTREVKAPTSRSCGAAHPRSLRLASRKVVGSGRTARMLLLALVAAVVLGGCGDRLDTDPPEPVGPLPANPQEWICAASKPAPTEAEIGAWCRAHADRGRPVPADLRDPPPPADFEAYQAYNVRLEQFLTRQEYAALGWVYDPNWRFSGPSVVADGSFSNNYGPHFPLRVYYSPEVVDWLCNGRQGEIPDGAMIMKAMSLAWAALDIRKAGDGCMDIVEDPAKPIQPILWAPMLKSSKASRDGWLWMLQQPDFGVPPQFPPPLLDRSAFTGGTFPEPIVNDPSWYPTGSVLQSLLKVPNVVTLIPLAGHPYCLSCHATAESESTFASMDNILGRELRYRAFDAGPAAAPTPVPSPASLSPFPSPLPAPSQLFLTFFDQLEPVTFADAWETRMPAETYDQQVISAHDGPGQFLTAAQCNACHNATPQSPLLPQMVQVEKEAGRSSPLRNLSPYGEWRVSAMALSGRDPVFFSQLQGETNRLAELTACIESTCLHCHGAMGARQFAMATAGRNDTACDDMFAIAPPPEVPFGEPFRRSALQQWPGSEPADQQYYGALARDGVSCTVCHHVAAVELGQERTFTGNFVTGPPDEIYGPYPDDTIVTKPMQHALGLTPMFGQQITSSDLCGSCHNILLPIFDNSGQRLGASYEQSTHLEWLNSDSGRPGKEFRSCQDCHMPTQYRGTRLEFKIANSESNDQFPPTTHRLPDDEIELTKRKRYSRHSLHGLNVFLNQFFQQFPLILGFQQIDWMSEQPSPLDPPAPPFASGYPMELPLFTGFESMLEMADQETATVEVGRLRRGAGQLHGVVTVRNLTGHYLPTGVGFRRMFLEFLVLDAQGEVLWASGRTNELGLILDGITGEVLESEQPARFPDAPVQPHHQTIVSGGQVQIYQELIRDSDGMPTTSFLRRVETIKDNRVRPKGYDPRFFARSTSPYIQELAMMHGEEAHDPHYVDPKLTGSDEVEYRVSLDAATLARADQVQVTLYYQSIPPFYLQERFADASQGPGHEDDIRRLYYLTSHLNLDGATNERGELVLQGWKLRIARDTRRVQ